MPPKRQAIPDDADQTPSREAHEAKYQRKRASITQARRPCPPSPPRSHQPNRQLFSRSLIGQLRSRNSQSQQPAIDQATDRNVGNLASSEVSMRLAQPISQALPTATLGIENPFIVPAIPHAPRLMISTPQTPTPYRSTIMGLGGETPITSNTFTPSNEALYTPSKAPSKPHPFHAIPKSTRVDRERLFGTANADRQPTQMDPDVEMLDISDEEPILPQLRDGDFVDGTFDPDDFNAVGSQEQSEQLQADPSTPKSSPPRREAYRTNMGDGLQNSPSPQRPSDKDENIPSPTNGQIPTTASTGLRLPRTPPSPTPSPPPSPFVSDDIGEDVTQTQAAAYTWKHKHQISDQAYQEMVDMATQAWFNVRELPFSATTLKSYSASIPTQQIKSKIVRVALSKNFSNTKKPWAPMYRYSVKDTIRRMLNNEQIVEQAHFGPRVEPANRKATEVHHGTLVGGSVLACPSLYPLRTPPTTVSKDGDYIMPGNCYRMKIKDPFNAKATVDFDVRLTQVLIKEKPDKRSKKQTTKESDANNNNQEQPPIQDPPYAFGKIYEDKDLTIKVQPIITNSKQLPLFGIAQDDDRFNFGEEDDHGAQTAYIIKHEFDTQLSRLLSKASVRIDRSKHNLDEALPSALGKKSANKKPRKRQAKPTPAKREQQKPSRRSTRSTRSQSRTPPPQSEDDSGSGTDSTRAGDSEDERGFDFFEGLMDPEDETDFPIVTDDPIDVSAEYAVRYIITPEQTSRWDHDMFFRAPRVRGAQGPEEAYHENRSLRRQGERLAKRYETKLRLVFVRLIHAGHLRETLAELELRKGEFSWDDLQASKDGKKPPRIGVYVDFYVDKFGVFRTMHRSAGGLYTTLLNLNFRGRDQPRNHACEGFLPNGWIKGSSANTCCRFCFASKEQTGDESFFHKERWEKEVMARNIHLVERFRREANATELNKLGIEPRRPICMTLGPAFDPYIQIPIDVSHSEQKGMGIVAIKNMMEKLFSETGKAEFTRVFTQHPLPTNVSKMVNPAYHLKRLQMHQVTTLMACMPFLLRKIDLSKGVFQSHVFERFQHMYPDRVGGWDTNSIMDYLIEAHLAIAKSNWLDFKRDLDIDKDYDILETSVYEARRLLMEFYKPLENTDAVFRRTEGLSEGCTEVVVEPGLV
ncbi:hypothetical protein BJ508DRAFT_336847 [Ascobolus immersus RN42]|uniref:Uncharacterized protein n=1 Tax=Ascobolus immersus RN42 TaxID=1160509 RepID=A0A3N4H9Z9_ASCIM|nr:hypothetical protein BJ508DRAFT_336847 [Ascobolus immersus RN42]